MPINNESVLESHFHEPLMDLFKTTFGLGSGGSMNYYKYSLQRECFVGFDQAYVQTQLSEDDFFNLLRGASQNNYQLPYNAQFLGYYLQYKVVNVMKNRSAYTPSTIKSLPHYRVNLDTLRNVRTGRSQHETLYNLSRNRGALTYYACPMVFDREDLYGEPNLDQLILADLSSCPSAYTDQQRHFIYFDNPIQNPIWCSNPVVGESLSAKQFARRLMVELNKRNPTESRRELFDELTDIFSIVRQNRQRRRDAYQKVFPNSFEQEALKVIADSLTILQINPD